ncbi:uncharacterized protein C6orf118 homolog [Rhea pennata]|uniref:uncharacterized protein C6orf118 homolog n=1 Tax=Rhea pennata TaxID=8795 RepID=UPI002E274580
MERSWQMRSLTHLLDSMEIAHKDDIKLYTSGHLNHNKLYKPSEKIRWGQWDSARKQTSLMRERDQLPAQNERARKMKKFSSNFYASIPPLPAHIIDSSFPTKRYQQSSVTRVGPPTDVSLTPLESLNLKAPKKKVKEGTDRLSTHLQRHELDVSEIMVLQNKPFKNSQQYVAEPAQEKYQFIPSYLAGITKTDQFNKFLHFQREFIANHELLQNDFTGSKVSKQHEMKLAKELQKIRDCDPFHFKRLQIAEKVFEDICNSSLIFGDILKEIKNEYELYMMILLDSLPTERYKTLKAQVKGMETRPSKAQEIHAARKDVQVLMKKAKAALARNQELQNELKMVMWVSQSPEDKTETCGDHETKEVVAETPSVAEQLESMRCKVLSTWEEMMILETEKKERMACAGMVDMTNTFRDVEELEDSITETLDKLHITQENQKKVWELIEEFFSLEEEEVSENPEEISQSKRSSTNRSKEEPTCLAAVIWAL